MSRERTVTLREARADLVEQYDDLEARASDADGSASGDAVRYSLSDLDLQGRAVATLIDSYGADAEVTVRGLTAGEFGRVQDRVDDFRARKDGDAAQGYHRNVYAAAGLVDAPFLDRSGDWGDLSARERLNRKIETVATLDPSDGGIGTAKWLYSLVDDATTPAEGNWRQRSAPPADGGSEG